MAVGGVEPELYTDNLECVSRVLMYFCVLLGSLLGV